MKYAWEDQPFDTEIFGFTVAKITQISPEGEPQDIQKKIASLIKELTKNQVNYATYRLSANEFALIHALEYKGFVTVDGIIAMNKDLKEAEAFINKKIRNAVMDDLPQLKQIVRKSFTANRFYNDPLIPKDKADMVYEQWVENSLSGNQADKVLVWGKEKEILGFITMQKKGHIPLVAVSAKARGKGIAKKLIEASISQFKKWDCQTIAIETSLGNIPALRAYEGCGFKISNSFVTLRWSSLA